MMMVNFRGHRHKLAVLPMIVCCLVLSFCVRWATLFHWHTVTATQNQTIEHSVSAYLHHATLKSAQCRYRRAADACV